MSFHVPEKYRCRKDPLGVISDVLLQASGNNGAFLIPMKLTQNTTRRLPHVGAVTVPNTIRYQIWCIASDGTDWERMGAPAPAWEHVSISIIDGDRLPTWDEMCFVKNLFWGEEDCVLQFHPPKSDYVNYRWQVLHLWRPIGVDFPRPPAECVGPTATEKA